MCTYNIRQFTKYDFHKLLNYFFMFQCNEHVEMNKCLCSLANNGKLIYIIESIL